ncbi:SDR family NAD(P)-dependent oxidoreductase [Salinarimonas sp.]|uniref:type I polyketide synthase n=1 Tax=Salinarimonas sp. TaxID=2766526 RepID=UPI0032D8D616
MSAPVAIVGAACRLPGGCDTPRLFWEALRAGRRLSTRDAFGPRLSAAAAATVAAGPADAVRLAEIDLFDAAFFGISPREAMRTDPQHRLFLETAIAALDAAGQPREALAGTPVGVFLGIASGDYAWLPEAMAAGADVHSAAGGGPVFAANRLSHALDLRGPSLAIDATCASSLVAVHLACRSLREGESALALAGGVNLVLSDAVASAAAQSVPFAADGLCKTFAADADGTVRGEGCVVLVLKRLAEARADGDPILAVILGSAVNHDGRASALTAPNPAAQAALIRAACADAGVAPEDVAYLEAHGTGTVLGDAIEIEAAAEALAGAARRRAPCRIGSVKAAFGHLEAAAGAAGLLRAALSLAEGRLAPHPLAGAPHPGLAAHAETLALARAGDALGPADRAGVSAFSLGGANAHVVLGPAPDRPPRAPPPEGPRIVPVSARSPGALATAIADLRAALDAPPLVDAALADIAHTACRRRSRHPHRRAFVADTRAELARQLALARPPEEPRPRVRPGEGLVLVFPGHGSQWAGMARGLAAREPAFAATLARLDALFAPRLGWSVAAALEEADAPAMARAEIGQPALLAVQLGLAALLRAKGLVPQGVLGYSAGELAAMVVAGMLDEADAVRIAATRATGLAAAEPPGAGGMLAVRTPPDTVPALIAETGGACALAAVCGPETVILSGPRAALDRLAERLERRDVLALDAGVPYAFHHPAMAEAADRMVARLGARDVAWRAPTIPVYSSVRGRALALGDLGPAYWRDGACATLRFDRAVTAALADGARTFLEVGPSAALTSDVRDGVRAAGAPARAIAGLRRGVPAARALALAAAELFEAGAVDDLAPFDPDGGAVVPLPTTAFERRSFWWPPLPVETPAPTPPAAGEPAPPAPDPKAYGLAWRPAPAEPPAFDAAALPLAAIDAACAAASARAGQDAYAAAEPTIDAACAAYAARALVSLGASLAPDARVPVDALATRLRLDTPARRLLERLAGVLEEDGVLAREPDAWRATGRAPHPDPDGALAALIPTLPQARHELALLARCGPRLADVLAGRVDPLTLIFPDGDAGTAAAIFSEAGSAQVGNVLLVEAVSAVLAGRSAGAPLRVLEIGAGTGGATAALRPLLERPGASVLATDVSRTLLRHAAARFEGWRGFSTERLDIARDPAGQGFAARRFDLVVCANVLHATPDVAAALAHARGLLAPGGALVLLELTQPQRLVDLTFGLTRDWWGFADTRLRPGHPLLARETWRGALAEAGLPRVAIAPEDPALSARAGLSVLVATEAPASAAAAGERWLVLGGDEETATAVAQALGRLGRDAVRGGAERLGGAIDGLVDLRLLGPRLDAAAPPQALLDALRPRAQALFETARALARREGRPPRLLALTAGALAVDSADAAPDPAQAALRASLEALAAEHPDWPLLALDVGGRAPGAVAAAVAEALARPGDAPFRASRRGALWTPELVRLPAAPRGPVRVDPVRAHLVAGGLGALGLDIAERLVARGARRLVLAQRGDGDAAALARVARLREAGVDVEIARVDLADPDAATAFAARLADARPGVAGIVHAAGVFDDALVIGQDWPRFLRALAPKAVGAAALLRGLAGRALDHVVLSSSVANLLDPAGLSNYAAGNAALAALAEAARREGVNATCIAWGGWTGLGMATRQSARWLERWRARGVAGLGPDDTDSALDRALAGAAPAFLAVADVDWSRCAAHLPAPQRALVAALARERVSSAGPPTESAAPAPAPALDVAALPPALRRERVRGEVRRRCLAMLELPDHFDLEPDLPLADLGLDSLLALELRADLGAAFGLDLPTTLLFDCPSLAALTDHIAGRAAA